MRLNNIKIKYYSVSEAGFWLVILYIHLLNSKWVRGNGRSMVLWQRNRVHRLPAVLTHTHTVSVWRSFTRLAALKWMHIGSIHLIGNFSLSFIYTMYFLHCSHCYEFLNVVNYCIFIPTYPAAAISDHNNPVSIRLSFTTIHFILFNFFLKHIMHWKLAFLVSVIVF